MPRPGIVLRAALLAACLPAVARGQSRDLRSYVLLAETSLRANGLTVASGDVGVNRVLGLLFAGKPLAAGSSVLVAPVVRIDGASSCQALFANTVLATGAACGPATAFTAPIVASGSAACGFPATFPACDSTRPKTVGAGGTLTLGPGTYGAVVIEGGGGGSGRLVLTGGSYTFCSLRAARGATIAFQGPSTVAVNGNVTLGNGTTAGPAPGSGLGAGDVVLHAAGTTVHFARNSRVQARLCAPNARLRLTHGGQHEGQFVAATVRAGRVSLRLGSTPTTTTTTTTAAGCGDGVVDAGEACDPPGSLTCGSAGGAFDGSPGGAFACSAHCTCPTSTTLASSTTTTTTSTTGPSSSTTSTLPAPVCGDGTLQGGERCDPPGSAVCPGSAAGALLECLDGCTCPDVSGLGQEVCGDCVDNDGNGATDFEDPACCPAARTFAMTLSRARIRPKASGTARVRLRGLPAQSGLADVNPIVEDVFLQLRPEDGADLLCARLPSRFFRKKRHVFKFVNRKGSVASARGLKKAVVRIRKNGSVRVKLTGKRVQLPPPRQGRYEVTLGFHTPAAGDAQNRCSSAVVPFRSARKGLRAP
jgi:hypothetical protein